VGGGLIIDARLDLRIAKVMHKCNEPKYTVSVSEGSDPEQANTTLKTVEKE